MDTEGEWSVFQPSSRALCSYTLPTCSLWDYDGLPSFLRYAESGWLIALQQLRSLTRTELKRQCPTEEKRMEIARHYWLCGRLSAFLHLMLKLAMTNAARVPVCNFFFFSSGTPC